MVGSKNKCAGVGRSKILNFLHLRFKIQDARLTTFAVRKLKKNKNFREKLYFFSLENLPKYCFYQVDRTSIHVNYKQSQNHEMFLKK